MIQLYSHPLSGNARRVWIALLEKQIPFELINLQLDGDQCASDFTAINPLQRVPALVDEGFKVVESLAILDYLEAKYPKPSLMPSLPEAIATVRMAEMAAVCDLQPTMTTLMQHTMGFSVDEPKVTAARARSLVVLDFFEQRLLQHQPYFLGDDLSLADIVAGTIIGFLPYFGVELTNYPKVTQWLAALSKRPAWQKTTPPADALEQARDRVQDIMRQRG